MRFLIVAVDGVLADTLSGRVAALQSAAHSLGVTLALPTKPRWIAGLGFAEAARASTVEAGNVDETMIDLLAHAAERSLQQQAAESAPVLFQDTLAQCAEAAAHGWRVILRTDATRRAAGPLLEHLLTETNGARAIAADDVTTTGADASMLQRQYALIAPTVHGATSVYAVEASAHARETVAAMLPELHMDWPTL